MARGNELRIQFVRGHSNVEGNEEVDRLVGELTESEGLWEEFGGMPEHANSLEEAKNALKGAIEERKKKIIKKE